MTNRRPFPERRSHEVIDAVYEPVPGIRMGIRIGLGRYDDGRLGEVFFDPDGSSHAPMMRDAAVLASIALQCGATIAGLVGSITRTEDGRSPSTMIGAALDAVAEREKGQ